MNAAAIKYAKVASAVWAINRQTATTRMIQAGTPLFADSAAQTPQITRRGRWNFS
jgi:hypothetical protein